VVWLKIKESRLELGSGKDLISVKIFLEKGKVIKVSISIVCEIQGKMECVLRYDCAHGFLHKDLCYKKPAKKETVDEELTGEFVEKAINHLKQNHEKYRELYMKNYGGKNE